MSEPKFAVGDRVRFAYGKVDWVVSSVHGYGEQEVSWHYLLERGFVRGAWEAELERAPVKPLTGEELTAAAWAVAHLIDKHGFSSIVGRDGSRVPLQDLLDKLNGLRDG